MSSFLLDELNDEIFSPRSRKEVEKNTNWINQTLIALFSEQHCDCGAVHRLFIQYLHYQTQLHHSVVRYQMTSRPDWMLPRKVMVQSTITHICSDCCKEYDFNWQNSPGLSTSSPLTPPTNYNPERPNAPNKKD